MSEQPAGCKSPYCEPPWCKNCGEQQTADRPVAWRVLVNGNHMYFDGKPSPQALSWVESINAEVEYLHLRPAHEPPAPQTAEQLASTLRRHADMLATEGSWSEAGIEAMREAANRLTSETSPALVTCAECDGKQTWQCTTCDGTGTRPRVSETPQ